MANDPKQKNTLLWVVGGVLFVAMVANWKSGAPNADPAPTPTASASPTGASDYQLRSYAEREVRSLLKDPDSATFSEVIVSRKAGVPAICGLVNSRNGFGGMTGGQRFISGGATVLEEQMAAGEMDVAWARLC